jgi:hypothetical protein
MHRLGFEWVGHEWTTRCCKLLFLLLAAAYRVLERAEEDQIMDVVYRVRPAEFDTKSVSTAAKLSEAKCKEDRFDGCI